MSVKNKGGLVNNFRLSGQKFENFQISLDYIIPMIRTQFFLWIILDFVSLILEDINSWLTGRKITFSKMSANQTYSKSDLFCR